MDNYYILRRIVRIGLTAVTAMVVMVPTISCNKESLTKSALEVLCCDSRIGPFEFKQRRLKDIIAEVTAASRTEWHRCSMHDGLEIEFSGSEDWLNQLLSFRIEELPILAVFHSLEEISNSDVIYSDGIISIQERVISKEEEDERFKHFHEILLSIGIDGSIHYDVSFVDLLRRLYEEANVQLNKNGHPSMGLLCGAITNVCFKSIAVPSGSIYDVFENVAGRIGAKVEYQSGNIIVTQTNYVQQSSVKFVAIDGLIMPADLGPSCSNNCVTVTIVPVKDDDALPGYKTIYQPLAGFVSESNEAVACVKVDCKVCIENCSEWPYVFGLPYSLTGYDCLEIDARLDNGEIVVLKRRQPKYLSDNGRFITVNPQRKWEYPISLDSCLWDFPSKFKTDKVVQLRPRFAFGAFRVEGEFYRTLDEVMTRKRIKRDFTDRDGELVGEWVDCCDCKIWITGGDK